MMTTSNKKKNKKKKGFMFMKRSSLQVWIGKDGKAHSKAKGSMEQTISNYNTMISYFKEQANSMAGSVLMTLGEIPDVIVGTVTKNPKLAASGGGPGYYDSNRPLSGGGNSSQISSHKPVSLKDPPHYPEAGK